ncbi:MAG: Omp28-related outer membrane protein [Bacteroidetes bacterium]|nr:Omp28-related outer membrane protein [Bacteroidota bacterium]
MKKLLLIPILASLSLFYQCEEEGPFIILEPTIGLVSDTTYISVVPVVAEQRAVLLEEFSGVRCPNCPEGNMKAEELETDFPGRVIVVTAHSDFLADPIGDDIDLRSDDADDLSTLIGGITSKPSASVNRKQFAGESKIAVRNVSSWEQYVSDELAITTPVNIVPEILSVDGVARTISFKVTFSYSQMSTGHSVGISLTESGLIADQRDGVMTAEDYEHHSVLRKSLTPIIGTPLAGDQSVDQVIIQEYLFDLDDYEVSTDWIISSMELTVYILDADGVVVHAARVEL